MPGFDDVRFERRRRSAAPQGPRRSTPCRDRRRDIRPWPTRCPGRPFDAAAGRSSRSWSRSPTRPGVGRHLRFAEGGAAGEVGQQAIQGVADAAARGGEPVVVGFAACRRGPQVRCRCPSSSCHRSRLRGRRPEAGLQVVADRAADQARLSVSSCRRSRPRGPARMCPSRSRR